MGIAAYISLALAHGSWIELTIPAGILGLSIGLGASNRMLVAPSEPATIGQMEYDAQVELEAPVVTMRIAFGGDNHTDSNLQAEADQHVSGIAGIQQVMDALAGLSLSDKVTFATMNVFGRNLNSIAKAEASSIAQLQPRIIHSRPPDVSLRLNA